MSSHRGVNDWSKHKVDPSSASLPKISVVTPSFNQGRFLDECIHSVLDQKYPNLEYLIVDGGSTDESAKVIGKYQSHLTWWVSEKDAGQADAINKGFRRCTGDLVAWINADDFYLPGALNLAAEAYRANPGASFFFGRCLRVGEDSTRKGEYVEAPQLLFNREAMIYGLNYIAQPSTFINRRKLEKAGYLNPALSWGLDSELWLKLSNLAPAIAIPHLLAASREHGQTKTSNGSFARIEELRRIAAQFSGAEMTPGAMCYFLDTFYKVVLQHPDVFPPEYRSEVTRFWAATSALFAQWGADSSGTPTQAAPPRKGVKDTLKKALDVL
jgi:hypothetical protein